MQQTYRTLEAAGTGGKQAEAQEIIHRERYYYIFGINPIISKRHHHCDSGWSLAWVNIGTASGGGGSELQVHQ